MQVLWGALAACALGFLAGCSSSTSNKSLLPTQLVLTASSASSTLNGSVTLTATLAASSSAVGVVTFFDGTSSLQAVDVTGKTSVTYTSTAFTGGTHTFTAIYAGDQNNAPSTSSAINFTVYVPTTATVSATPTTAGVGGSVTLTGTVSAGTLYTATGNVTFTTGSTYLGSATLSAGTATLATTALPLGTDPVIATYAPSSYFLGSTSASTPVIIHPALINTSLGLTSTSTGNIASGTLVTFNATLTPVSVTVAPTGTVTFLDGTTVIGTVTLANKAASLSSKQFTVGANSITAVYSGDSVYNTSTSTPAINLTLSSYTGSTYTNPLSLTDAVNNTGKVYNCPDPAIYKYQSGNSDTWYAYCTGDAFNSTDKVNGNFRAHLISIFSSSDLVNWTYVRDAFTALPSWVATGNELQTPAIKFINGQYLLYYEAPAVTASPGGSAIGVGTASSPAGPFTDSGGPVVNQQIACGGGCNRTVFSPEVIADQTGQLWIAYGGIYAGLSIRQLSANGLTSNAGTEVNIAVDNYYTNPYILYRNGYFYEFATPAGGCCGGAYSTYSVRVGRSASITGPYLDAEGNDLNAYAATSGTNGAPGGDTVLVNTGNTIVGPGSNTTFTDESGQDYIFYSGVSTNQQYLPNVSGYTARQLMMDPLDWVNGWPVVRNGTGDSDAAQPVPAAQPGASNGYVPPALTPDAPGTLMAAYSQDFGGATAYASQFTVLHNANGLTTGLTASCLDPGNNYANIPGVSPGFSATGLTICSNFAESTSVSGTYSMANLPILAEAEPTGNYMAEIKFHSLTPPTGCCSYLYPAEGMMIYSSDTVYLRLDDWADYDTRQLEFLNQFGASSSAAYTASAPVGTPYNAGYTYLRVAKRITNTTTGAATYTSYSSIDGITWIRGPAWNVNFGTTAKIGIFSDNLGEGATFSYIHVSTLTP